MYPNELLPDGALTIPEVLGLLAILASAAVSTALAAWLAIRMGMGAMKDC